MNGDDVTSGQSRTADQTKLKRWAVLTVSGRGQTILSKEVLHHLAQPGKRIELSKMPDGQVEIRADRRTGKINDLFGLLAGKTMKIATLEEINEAAAAGWAGE